MGKYYTTIEQSNKLVELGIDVDTADMCFDLIAESEWYGYPISKNLCSDDILGTLIPCWSTEALMKLLPRETNDYSLRDIHPTITGKYKISYSYRGMYDEFTITRDTLCECAYETIVKLKELKLL